MPVAKFSQEFYKRFGDKATDELVDCLNTIESGYRAEIRDLFDAQFERYRELFERRLTETRGELREDMASLRGGMASLRAEVRLDIGNLRSEMLKWNLLLWAPVTLAVIGLYFR